MGIRNIEILFPWDEVEPFPYPPETYIPPTEPEPEPEVPPAPKFVVNDPDSNGIFTMSGTDAVAVMLDASTYQLNTPLVTLNGNGTYTATSE